MADRLDLDGVRRMVVGGIDIGYPDVAAALCSLCDEVERLRAENLEIRRTMGPWLASLDATARLAALGTLDGD